MNIYKTTLIINKRVSLKILLPLCDVKTKLAVVPNCLNLIATFDCSSQDADVGSDSSVMKKLTLVNLTMNSFSIVWLATLKSIIKGVVVVVAVVVVAVVVVVVVSGTIIVLVFCKVDLNEQFEQSPLDVKCR